MQHYPHAYTILEHRDVALKFVPFFFLRANIKINVNGGFSDADHKTMLCLWEGICDIVFENQSVSLSGS